MRSEDFSLSFAKNIDEFVILGRDIRKVRSFCKFCKISSNVRRVKTKFEIMKTWEFNIHQNAAAPMIVMLGHSELDMEVSDAGMETMESNDYRGVFRKNGNTNSILAIT